MQDYKSVEEFSLEWNISARYIQNLCKSGHIAGAIKKAGVWLIPGDALSPAKRKLQGDSKFAFSGTKREIFRQSMTLIIEHGFENVSMRAIASAVGVKQSAIYNHFTSKQEILDTIYDFFCYYYIMDRPSLEDVEATLHNGSLMDIVMSVWYEFREEHQQELFSAVKIIFQRASIDNRAREIAKSTFIDEGNRFAKFVFDRAVEIGRLAPFDTHAMSVFINSIRLYVFYNWILDDSLAHLTEVGKDEQIIYRHALKILTDLNPPS